MTRNQRLARPFCAEHARRLRRCASRSHAHRREHKGGCGWTEAPGNPRAILSAGAPEPHPRLHSTPGAAKPTTWPTLRSRRRSRPPCTSSTRSATSAAKDRASLEGPPLAHRPRAPCVRHRPAGGGPCARQGDGQAHPRYALARRPHAPPHPRPALPRRPAGPPRRRPARPRTALIVGLISATVVIVARLRMKTLEEWGRRGDRTEERQGVGADRVRMGTSDKSVLQYRLTSK
jgi:hypothetical protein